MQRRAPKRMRSRDAPSYLANPKLIASLLVALSVALYLLSTPFQTLRAGKMTKMKILALHGYSTNSLRLQANLEASGLAKALDQVDWVFLDATFPLEGSDGGFKWYDRGTDASGATLSAGVETGIERVKQLVKDQSVDAILGFSQGGSVASLATALSADPSWPGSKFKFALLLASGNLVDDRYTDTLASLKSAGVPSFHSFSKDDQYYGEGQATLKLFEGSPGLETYEHNQGHKLPLDDAAFIKKVVDFVAKHSG